MKYGVAFPVLPDLVECYSVLEQECAAMVHVLGNAFPIPHTCPEIALVIPYLAYPEFPGCRDSLSGPFQVPGCNACTCNKAAGKCQGNGLAYAH